MHISMEIELIYCIILGFIIMSIDLFASRWGRDLSFA